MQATLESLDGLERRLNVSLPQAEIDTEVTSRLRKIARTAKISGFRPGKVPLKIVEQQFGPQVRQEVLGDVVKRSFGDAVREQNLRVAGLPSIEPRPVGEKRERLRGVVEILLERRLVVDGEIAVEPPVDALPDTRVGHRPPSAAIRRSMQTASTSRMR
jgi:trigger factor